MGPLDTAATIRAARLVNKGIDKLEGADDPVGALALTKEALGILGSRPSALAVLHRARARQVRAEAYLKVDQADNAVHEYQAAIDAFAASGNTDLYVRCLHDAAITFGNLGLTDLAKSCLDPGKAAAEGRYEAYFADFVALELEMEDPLPETYRQYLDRLMAAVPTASASMGTTLWHRIVRTVCEFGEPSEVDGIFEVVRGLLADARTIGKRVSILASLNYLARDLEPAPVRPIPDDLSDIADAMLRDLGTNGDPHLRTQLLVVRAVAAWSRDDLPAATEACLEAVALSNVAAWQTGSSTVRYLTDTERRSIRDLALRVVCRAGDAPAAAEVIESSRLPALPDRDAPPELIRLTVLGRPAEYVRRPLTPLHPIVVAGSSRLARYYPPNVPLAEAIDLDAIIDRVAGGGGWWWGAVLGANDRLFWALRDERSRYSCGALLALDGKGQPILREAMAACPAMGTHEASRRGPFTTSYQLEDRTSLALGRLLLPPALTRAALRAFSDASEPPLSLMIASDYLSLIPLPLLGLPARSEQGAARLIEAATLRIAPPAAVLGPMLRARGSSPPFIIAAACHDPSPVETLVHVSTPTDARDIFGGPAFCRDNQAARLGTRANLVDALRRSPGVGEAFVYAGHASQVELSADLASRLDLIEPHLPLTAQDIMVGLPDGQPVPFPERVLLAACSTAGSSGAGSGEWLGLTAAVLMAGAREVIATAWPIWDVPIAADLDVALAEAVRSGTDLAVALRVVQLDALARWRATANVSRFDVDPDASDSFPLVWGAYQACGIPPAPPGAPESR